MITTCTQCGQAYEAGSEEQANETKRYCTNCWNRVRRACQSRAMTFIEWLESCPGQPDYAMGMYRRIDAEAEKIGVALANRHQILDDLRTNTGSPWLKETCNALADALEKDPSGKLAAVPSLLAWADERDGIGKTWVRWWVTFYCSWLDAQKAPKLVPMMAAAE
jgi:predicted  nucleic acid-binding Zn-ribbon protein